MPNTIADYNVAISADLQGNNRHVVQSFSAPAYMLRTFGPSGEAIMTSVKELRSRFDRACEMKQPVDRQVIAEELLKWAQQIGAPDDTTITFVASEADMRNAVFASTTSAGVGRSVDRALCTENAKKALGKITGADGHIRANEIPWKGESLGLEAPMLPRGVSGPVWRLEHKVTKPPNWIYYGDIVEIFGAMPLFLALAFAAGGQIEFAALMGMLTLAMLITWVVVWFRKADYAPKSTFFDSRHAHCFAYIAVGAKSAGDEKTADQWMPVLKAFEAGAFTLWLADTTIFVATIPSFLQTDEDRRLHCETGPAFVWLDGAAEYFWHGTAVPKSWITDRSSLTPQMAVSERNAEQRRAAIDILGGWAQVLPALGGREIDKDLPHIGTLIEVSLPDLETPARFNKVLCGTGRTFAYGVPPHVRTAREAQAFRTRMPVESWREPEVRT